jgi:protoporphyrinogen IX oxidase
MMKKKVHMISGMSACLIAVIFSLSPSSFYLWVKALHIIAIISWMAGLLYLPRLFVYHCEAKKGSQSAEMLKLMEYRLLTFIITPAMIFSWVLGLWLAWFGFNFSGLWLILKLIAVIGLTICSVYFSRSVKKFAMDENVYTSRFWRIMNEVPTVFMIIIVILVVVKPF